MVLQDGKHQSNNGNTKNVKSLEVAPSIYKIISCSRRPLLDPDIIILSLENIWLCSVWVGCYQPGAWETSPWNQVYHRASSLAESWWDEFYLQCLRRFSARRRKGDSGIKMKMDQCCAQEGDRSNMITS